MEKQVYPYQKLRDASKLLKDRELSSILKDIFENQNFLKAKVQFEDDLVVFLQENGEKIYLDWNDFAPIFIKYHGEDLVEQFRIHLSDGIRGKNGIMVDQTLVERRPYGFVVTEIDKNYLGDSIHSIQREVNSLEERRCVYTYQTLLDQNYNVYRNHFFEDVMNLVSIGVLPDFKSVLKIFNINLDGDVKVLVNGEDLTYLYDNLFGRDLVCRIFDLYHGEITELNNRDIYLIRLSKLNEEAFGLIELNGIVSKENELVGEQFENLNETLNSFKVKFLREQFGVIDGNLKDRDILLEYITVKDETVYKEVNEGLENVSFEKEEFRGALTFNKKDWFSNHNKKKRRFIRK